MSVQHDDFNLLHLEFERSRAWTDADTDAYLAALNAIRHHDLAEGTHSTAKAIDRHVDDGLHVLTHLPNGPCRPRLARVVCDAATLASWQLLDAAKYPAAWRMGTQAATIGIDSDRIETWAYASAQRANILHDLGQHDLAVELVDDVTARVGGIAATSPVFTAWLHGTRGEAAAHVGDAGRAKDEFDEGDRSLAAAEPDPELPFLFLTPAQLHRWRGHALAVLGDPGAVDILEEAYAELDGTSARANTALQVDLATAHLRAGNHGQAQHFASAAAESSEHVGSARNLRRALEVLHALGDG